MCIYGSGQRICAYTKACIYGRCIYERWIPYMRASIYAHIQTTHIWRTFPEKKLTPFQRRSRPSLLARKTINRGRLGSFVHSLTLSQLHRSKAQVWRRRHSCCSDSVSSCSVFWHHSLVRYSSRRCATFIWCCCCSRGGILG